MEKEFYTIFVKERSKYNPVMFFLGKYISGWFVPGRQPKGYIEAFEAAAKEIDLSVKDIIIKK